MHFGFDFVYPSKGLCLLSQKLRGPPWQASWEAAPAWPVTIIGRCRHSQLDPPHPHYCASNLSPCQNLVSTFPLLHQLDTGPSLLTGPSVHPAQPPVVVGELTPSLPLPPTLSPFTPLLSAFLLPYLHPLGRQEQGPSSLPAMAGSRTSARMCGLCHLLTLKPSGDFQCHRGTI